MKIVIADRLSLYVDSVYDNASYHSGITLLLATFFFSFQIYCDFAGYSNIAIGCGKLLGFNFIRNFNRPYMAVSVADFWKRWHISLSTWFRDYVYIPLGGNRCSTARNYYNLMITFLVSGLWHGANWTFIVWGGLNGFFQVSGKMLQPCKKFIFSRFPNLELSGFKKSFDILVTFGLISFTWIFFRANNVNDSLLIVKKIFQFKGDLFTSHIESLVYGVFLIAILIISDVLQEKNNGIHYFLENRHKGIRYISYMSIIIIILMIGVFDSSQFIYFQF